MKVGESMGAQSQNQTEQNADSSSTEKPKDGKVEEGEVVS